MPTALPILPDFSLRAFNTFGIDVAAHAYLRIDDPAQLHAVCRDAALRTLPRLILGGGSNILLTQDFPGLVLHMATTGISEIGRDGRTISIRAAAGESWHGLVLWTLAHGIGGLENLSLIPGSVGASPIQNIGAYGVEVGELIASLRYFDFDTGEIVSLDRAACEFGYRDSVFKHRLRERAVILDVTFRVPLCWTPQLRYAELAAEVAAEAAADVPARLQAETGAASSLGKGSIGPAAISAAVIAIRSRKLPDPAKLGNAGSFFKNPVVSAATREALAARWPGLPGFVQPDGSFKLAAGWLIEQCGWKGKSLGAAGVYEKQALVLVNRGGASGAEIWHLAQTIQADVQSRYGVLLEAEPIVL